MRKRPKRRTQLIYIKQIAIIKVKAFNNSQKIRERAIESSYINKTQKVITSLSLSVP